MGDPVSRQPELRLLAGSPALRYSLILAVRCPVRRLADLTFDRGINCGARDDFANHPARDGSFLASHLSFAKRLKIPQDVRHIDGVAFRQSSSSIAL